ncbi:MAG: leucyl aminopeptidase [Gemmatimonadota bacterium]
MELKAVKGDVTTIETPALVVNLYQGVKKPGGATGAIDRALDGQLAELIADGEITGKPGEVTIVHSGGRIPARRVVVVGLGKKEKCDLEAVRRGVGSVTRRLLEHGITRFHTVLHGGGGLSDEAGTREIGQAVAEAALMAAFRDERYKTVEEEEEPGRTEPRGKKELAGITVVEGDGRKLSAIRRGLDRGERISRAVNYTRELGNTPPNEMTPACLAERALELAEEHGMECEILDRAELQEMKMGGILGVGSGSANEPRLIVLRFRGGPKAAPPTAVVGKAVTFDTGGISIKPAARMEDMKFDKMGGCAVLGILKAAALLELKKNLIGIVPAAENMPSGTAYRPGDILRSYSGKTIEIINTDAEGRLILADALAWAAEQEPREIIDLATLTGACVVALADIASGAFGDEDLVERMVEAGKRTGDRAWPLPVYQEFGDKMKSEVADIKNSTADAWGGASNAAAFLKFFVSDGIPWVHLDIAGTAWVNKQKAYHPVGATGAGVRLVIEYLSRR